MWRTLTIPPTEAHDGGGKRAQPAGPEGWVSPRVHASLELGMRTVLLAGWALALPSLAAAGPAKVDRGHSGVLFQAHHFEAG